MTVSACRCMCCLKNEELFQHGLPPLLTLATAGKIAPVDFKETPEAQVKRYDRYLRCPYEHPKTPLRNFYCSKCGFSENSFK